MACKFPHLRATSYIGQILRKKWRNYVLSHLRHIEFSSQIADMIVRPTTINVLYIYPCKLRGLKRLWKYNISYTWWWILDLSKTLCWRKRRVMFAKNAVENQNCFASAFFVMIGQANHPLSTANFCLHGNIYSALKIEQCAYNLLISGKKAFFRREGVWYLCCLETIWSTKATKAIPYTQTLKVMCCSRCWR